MYELLSRLSEGPLIEKLIIAGITFAGALKLANFVRDTFIKGAARGLRSAGMFAETYKPVIGTDMSSPDYYFQRRGWF